MRPDCAKPRRRGGRWVCEAETHLGPAVRRMLARTAEGRARAVRRGGRWIPLEQAGRDPLRGLKRLAGYAWILAAPLLGMAWAHNAYVRPDVAATEAAGAAERLRLLDRQDALRAQITSVQSDTELILAEVDTLHMPRVMVLQAALDSLSRREPRIDLARLQTRIDSLEVLSGHIALDIDGARRSLAAQQALFANLQGWQRALGDSLVGLDRSLAVSTAELERASRRQDLHAVWSRVWYLFGPALGVLWTQES